MALEKSGDVTAAIADYEATLALTPQWSQAQKRLTKLRESQGVRF
jgi:predicted TPR repeat methyltransferase